MVPIIFEQKDRYCYVLKLKLLSFLKVSKASVKKINETYLNNCRVFFVKEKKSCPIFFAGVHC